MPGGMPDFIYCRFDLRCAMTFQVGDRVRILSSVSEIDSSEGTIFGIDFFDDDLIYGVILDLGNGPSRLY